MNSDRLVHVFRDSGLDPHSQSECVYDEVPLGDRLVILEPTVRGERQSSMPIDFGRGNIR